MEKNIVGIFYTDKYGEESLQRKNPLVHCRYSSGTIVNKGSVQCSVESRSGLLDRRDPSTWSFLHHIHNIAHSPPLVREYETVKSGRQFVSWTKEKRGSYCVSRTRERKNNHSVTLASTRNAFAPNGCCIIFSILIVNKN